jgi:hypothetical protein
LKINKEKIYQICKDKNDAYLYFFNPIISFLINIKINLYLMTLICFLLSCLAVVFILIEQIPKAGAVGILLAICEITSNLVAKKTELTKNNYRKLLDLIIFNYIEILFFSAVIVYTLEAGQLIYTLLAFLSLVGIATSRIIKLAGRLNNLELNNPYCALIKRPERFFIISILCLFGMHGLGAGLLIITLISNIISVYYISKIWFIEKSKLNN